MAFGFRSIRSSLGITYLRFIAISVVVGINRMESISTVGPEIAELVFAIPDKRIIESGFAPIFALAASDDLNAITHWPSRFRAQQQNAIIGVSG